MKVLVINTVGLGYDGITGIIKSYFDSMDLTGLEVYVVGTIEVKLEVRKKLNDLGCKIVDMPSRKEKLISYFIGLVRFIRKEHVSVLHAHGNSGTLAIEMFAGWLGGCKKRIAHSHNTTCEHKRADKILRPLFYLLYTHALACGIDAGRWLFGNKNFTVLKNGRDIDTFRYKPEVREYVREEYNLGNSMTIGHVGGFVEQKNHKYLLRIYRAILDKEPTAHFFMIGDGALREEIENLAKEYGIYEKITFTGNTDRVPELLQAMDGMLLPSLFEGLPLVTIEWQIAGLPSVVSDEVTRECKITDSIVFLSLNDTYESWAEKIIMAIKSNNREKTSRLNVENIKKSGFDISDNSITQKRIYLEN